MSTTTDGGESGASATRPVYRSIAETADALTMTPAKIKQLLRDRALVAVTRAGRTMIPAAFVANGEIVKGLSGTITLLADGGLSDEQIIEWLYDPNDPADPGSCAIDLLRAGRGRFVHRQAQIAGF